MIPYALVIVPAQNSNPSIVLEIIKTTFATAINNRLRINERFRPKRSANAPVGISNRKIVNIVIAKIILK